MSNRARVMAVVEQCLLAGDAVSTLSGEMTVNDVAEFPKTVEEFISVLQALTRLMGAHMEDASRADSAPLPKYPIGDNN